MPTPDDQALLARLRPLMVGLPSAEYSAAVKAVLPSLKLGQRQRLVNECLCSSQASAKLNHFQRDEQFFAIAAARKKNPKSQRATYPAPPRREQKAVRRRHRKRIRIEKEKKAS